MLLRPILTTTGLRTWATEGHSVPLPGLGTMRLGVRSKAVENLEDVKTSLITTRRIVTGNGGENPGGENTGGSGSGGENEGGETLEP